MDSGSLCRSAALEFHEALASATTPAAGSASGSVAGGFAAAISDAAQIDSGVRSLGLGGFAGVGVEISGLQAMGGGVADFIPRLRGGFYGVPRTPFIRSTAGKDGDAIGSGLAFFADIGLVG